MTPDLGIIGVKWYLVFLFFERISRGCAHAWIAFKLAMTPPTARRAVLQARRRSSHLHLQTAPLFF